MAEVVVGESNDYQAVIQLAGSGHDWYYARVLDMEGHAVYSRAVIHSPRRAARVARRGLRTILAVGVPRD